MGAGGPPHAQLTRACASAIALSVHGVGLSIGSTEPLDRDASDAAEARSATAISPRAFPSTWPGRRTTASISTICCRCPTPSETLARVAEHVDEVQDRARAADAAGESVDLSAASPTARSRRSISCRDCRGAPAADCCSTSTTSSSRPPITALRAESYLDAFPLDRVRRNPSRRPRRGCRRCRRAPADRRARHAGRRPRSGRSTREVLARTGPLPTLIEWDNDVPAWPVLRAEAAAARDILSGVTRASAA